MRKHERKLLCLLAALLLMLPFTFAAAESIPGLPDQLDEDKAAVTVQEPADPEKTEGFTELFGEGKTMQIGLMTDMDTVGARYVFLGYKVLHRGMVVLLRISEEEVICWEMSRTEENTSKIRQFFGPDAPVCSIASFEKKQLKKNAAYLRDAEGADYESFLADTEKVIASLPAVRPLVQASADDPLLKDYAGVSWDMTGEELKKVFSKGRMISSSSTIVCRRPSTLYGTVVYTVSVENDRAKRIIVTVSDDKAFDLLRVFFKNLYGTEMRSQYARAVAGIPKEDPEGNTLVWTSGDTLICMNDKTIHYLPFNP